VPTDVLLITGAAGVGKSTVSWEVSDELKRRGLPHAVIDTDELDRVWPLDLDDPRRRAINVANLTAWWSGYRDLGVERRATAWRRSGRGHRRHRRHHRRRAVVRPRALARATRNA
jgi:phosphoribulokinase